MRLLFLLSIGCVLSFSIPSFGQNDSYDWQYACGVWETQIELHASKRTAFSISLSELPLDAVVHVRVVTKTGIRQTTWQHDPHLRTADWTSPIIVTDDSLSLFLSAPQRSLVQVHRFAISQLARMGKQPVTLPPFQETDDDCSCLLPAIVDRSTWCPAGCPPQGTPANTEVTHFIVHHSAGLNFSNDWAAVVEAIYLSHTGGNGWADIGYNYLIDPNGVVYEGRGEDVRGAHFCGTNSNTMGVCVLGNFMQERPTNAALGALENLLAWKACRDSIDVTDFDFHAGSGLSLFHISGHQDGCATACPGDSLYPLLPTIRTNTADLLEPCVQLTAPFIQLDTNNQLGALIISWDSIEVVDGYVLERQSGADFMPIASLPANRFSFVDTDVNADQEYCYRLRSFVQTDTSEWSSIECGSWTMLTNTSTTDFHQDIQLFPNPFGKWLQLSAKAPMELRILDSKGRLIHQLDAVSEQEIRVATDDWTSGVYFCVFTTTERTWMELFVHH